MTIMDANYFGTVHFIWWILWVGVLVWISFAFWRYPKEKRIKNVPLDILKKRFASGEITKDRYLENKKLLEAILLRSGFVKSIK